MTKADFLQLLERALSQLSDEERRANLEYYSELLDDMMEEGMSETEATAKLGSPNQIARHILQEMPLSNRRRIGYSVDSDTCTHTDRSFTIL